MIHIEAEAADKLLAAASEAYKDLGYHERTAAIATAVQANFPGKHVMVKVAWGEPYYRTASQFLSETLPKLLALATGDFDSVRCVFWFDN